MGLLEEKRPQALESAERLRGIVVQQTGDLTSNTRWYATLILAMLAGLVKYRQLTEQTSLRQFSIIVALLGVALALFVVASLLAQWTQIGFLRRLQDFHLKVEGIDSSRKLNADEALEELLAHRRSFDENADKTNGEFIAQFLGLIVFLVGAVFGILFVFFLEIGALF